MKKNNKTIEDRLENASFKRLTAAERDKIWQGIATKIGHQPVLSPLTPWTLSISKRKTMVPLLIAALMFAGAGGAVVSADHARPGDALFGVDRAVENVRLSFAGSAKAELKAKFAEERLKEVKELVAEARIKGDAHASTTATSTRSTTTPSKKASRDNVALGVSTALSFLNDISADLEASGNTEAQARIESVIDQLEGLVNAEDVKFRLKQNGDFQLRLKGQVSGSASSTATSSNNVKVKIDTSGNKDRIEVREDGERIRIELKSGDLFRIKTDVRSDDDDDNATSSVKTRNNSGKGKGLLNRVLDLDDDDDDN